jgi:hypothetical protein
MSHLPPAASTQEDSVKQRRECPLCNNHEGISILASHTCKFFGAIEDPAGTMLVIFPELPASGGAGAHIDLATQRQGFKNWAATSDGNCSPRDLRENPPESHERAVEGETFISGLVERDWQVWQAAVEWHTSTSTTAERHNATLSRTSQSTGPIACSCSRCLDESGATVEIFAGYHVPASGARMVLCAICHNKRCPHAADHRNVCTDSNEPGQPGSNYADLPAPAAQTLWEAIRGIQSHRQLRAADLGSGAHDHVSNEPYMTREIDSLREVLLLALSLLRANGLAAGDASAEPSERTANNPLVNDNLGNPTN